MSLDPVTPAGVGPAGLVEFDAVDDAGTGAGGGDEQAAGDEVVLDIGEEGGEVLFRDVFEDLPGGDQVERGGGGTGVDGERARDIAREEAETRQGAPVGASVFQGVIGAFEADGCPPQRTEVGDELAAGAAEVHESKRAGGEGLALAIVEGEDELTIGAVVVFGAVGDLMIGGGVGDGVLGVDAQRLGCWDAADAARGDEEGEGSVVEADVKPGVEAAKETSPLAGEEQAERQGGELTQVPEPEEEHGHRGGALRGNRIDKASLGGLHRRHMRTRLPACLVTGAAGFIGSHVVDRLLGQGRRVVGLDNLRLGRRANLDQAFQAEDFTLLEGDVNDYAVRREALETLIGLGPFDRIWHLAANSDIRAGVADPLVDLHHTFLSTYSALRLAQVLGVREFAFASSSAIYGPHEGAVHEDQGPWWPSSNYGAMKLASEAAISAAMETQLERAWVFRFPNVVGPRATHGVILDLVRKLQADRTRLEVLGDGRQEKPYLHVTELVEAMDHIVARAGRRWNVYNIGPLGTSTSVRAIAEAVVRRAAPGARIEYTGGDRGWPGDIPRFQYSVEQLLGLGWRPRLSSDEAVARAIDEVVREVGA